MQNYLIVIAGWLLGSFLVMVVKSIQIQKDQKLAVSFTEAFKIYFVKDTGPNVLSAIVLLIALFVLPGVFAPNTPLAAGDYIQNVIKNLRWYSVLFGCISQGIGYLIVSKANELLQKLSEENKQSTNKT